MENREDSKKLLNLIAKNNVTLKYGLLAVAVAIIGYCLSIMIGNRALPDATELSDVNGTNIFTECTLVDVTDHFAETTEDGRITEKFYFGLTDKDEIGVFKFSDYQFDKICEAVENDETYHITGMSKDIDFDFRKIISESFNEIMGEDLTTSLTVGTYVKLYEIDATVGPNSSSEGLAIFAVFFAIVGGVTLLVYGGTLLKAKSTIKKFAAENDLSTLVSEMEIPRYDNKLSKTIITNNYIISYAAGLVILKIADLVWAYPYTMKTNGVRTNQKIMVMLKDRKMYGISDTGVSKKKDAAYNETLEAVCTCKENILAGYTAENIDATRKANMEETLKLLGIE